jgi:Taurine catabolism dioxygenase TauD, TfdA family
MRDHGVGARSVGDEPEDGITRLDEKTTALLLSRRIPPTQPAPTWPRGDAGLARQPAVRRVCAHLDATLRTGVGFAVVRLAAGVATTPHEVTEACWNLFTSLADPLPHSVAGELLYDVAVAATPPPPHRYYSQSSIGGDIHTDGTYIHAEPPLYVALVCLQPAPLGGQSIIVDGRRVYRALEDGWPWALGLLECEYHFDCDGQRDGDATVLRRLMQQVNGSVRVQYLRTYVIAGHRRAGAPLSAAASASMDVLDALLQRDELRHVLTLAAGEMLLLNNHTMLHGRTAFLDGADRAARRHLVRLWGRPRAAGAFAGRGAAG